jgi:hypothetical protein
VHLAGEIRYMTTSIDLDRQAYLCAIEVENVPDERVLAAELQLAETTIS